MRSLFFGVCSTASSLGKLDPGSYRRVSEPQARRVMPVASLSGWRERWPLWLLWAVGQAVGSAMLADGRAPCVEARRGPDLT